jgi:tetratricopeptide (TPR) repeat protein
MQLLHSATLWRRALLYFAPIVAIAVIVSVAVHNRLDNAENTFIAAARALHSRPLDARLASAIEYRPRRGATASGDLNGLTQLAVDLHDRWESELSTGAGRLAGAALLLADRNDDAVSVLTDVLRHCAGTASTLDAVHECRDAPLLIDFSAAMLTRTDPWQLLLAFEAADIATQLEPSAAAWWNHALAASRLGFYRVAMSSWREAAREPDARWSREAAERLSAVKKTATASNAASPEHFFHVELIAIARAVLHGQPGAGENRLEIIAEDRLADDTIESIARLQPADRQRVIVALDAFSRGRTAFLDGRPREALADFSAAERVFAARNIPLQFLARDQRTRTECWLAATTCLDQIRALRADLTGLGRYQWLTARAAFAEGQANYRAGRIYDAVESMEYARAEFARVRDIASRSFMDSLLGNAYAAGGESDVALTHYLAAITTPAQNVSDRRRKQLEDPLMFMLRHGYIAAADAILEELTAAPSTEAALVMESTLRGVVAVRRRDLDAARTHFDRARAQLAAVSDETSRAEVRRALAIAQAGSGTASSTMDLDDLDASVSVDQQEEISIWLPQLLTQRGIAFESRRDDVRAEQDYRRAAEILERREPRIDQTMLSLGIAYDGESPFDRAIRLLLRQRRFSDALVIAERAAALRVSALYARTAHVSDVFEPNRHPASSDVVTPLRDILGNNEAAIAYHFLRDELVTWIVTAKGVIVVRRGYRRDDFIASVGALRDCTARGRCGDDVVLNRVSDLLVRDWIDSTARDATLLIQQPPELDAVPFSLLRTRGGERLLQRNALATAPSLHAFVRASQKDIEKSESQGAFFAAAPSPGGNRPYLPAAGPEVTRASPFHAGAAVDVDATRERFLERAPSYAIVHFAGHVIVNNEQPLMSALVFDPGANESTQLLHMHELAARTFRNARLVVLSACETGRAPRPTMSIANALLSQSVPSVVYTSWPVEDDAAEDFAVAFHRAISNGSTRAEAVREASLSLFQADPNRADAWAAFALAGEPGAIDTNGGMR